MTDLPAGDVAHDGGLAGLCGLETAIGVAVALCEEEGDEVDTRPGLLAGEFPGKNERRTWSEVRGQRSEIRRSGDQEFRGRTRVQS